MSWRSEIVDDDEARPHKQTLTNQYMTRFEHTRVLAARADQINKGARVKVVLQPQDTDAYFIAKRELEVFLIC